MNKKKELKETKKKVVKVPNREERYVEDGEDKVKTTYPDGSVTVSTL